ncbi:hypothetical protein [Streptomyces sp. NPDC090057]
MVTNLQKQRELSPAHGVVQDEFDAVITPAMSQIISVADLSLPG